MLSKQELLYTLALQRCAGLGDTLAKKLIYAVGSAEGIFKEKKSNLLKIEGIGGSRLNGLDSKVLLKVAEDEIRFIEEQKIDCHYFKAATYPERLKQCVDGPILIFSKGNINLNNRKILSIVGTRRVTSYGVKFCERFIEEISPLNPIIVSGFAYGVDITAQLAAVNRRLQTIGCLAHGFNEIYPRNHRRYVEAIENHGGFLTEFWSDDPFDRNNFLKRNRIIAGMTEATIVIESAEKGGSLVTADIANSYNRDVFAVPGRSTDKQSIGCNNLIKSQQAHLLTSAADLIYILGWDLNHDRKPTRQLELFKDLSEEQHKIYHYLKEHDKKHLDLIALECNLPAYKVASTLLEMELMGLILPLPGKQFSLH
ncbi:MAG: DNA-protecting protein DprA [Flavobacteriaceae bacterium]|nr:DNA-protecting protein DprA [Flavobacteriaceae bacterium]